MNLRQERIFVKEYSFKFVKHSKYASSLVSIIRKEMRMFVTGISKNLEEECRVANLHDNIDLARLMVHA